MGQSHFSLSGLHIDIHVNSSDSLQRAFLFISVLRFHVCRFYPSVRLSHLKHKPWEMHRILLEELRPFAFWSSTTWWNIRVLPVFRWKKQGFQEFGTFPRLRFQSEQLGGTVTTHYPTQPLKDRCNSLTEDFGSEMTTTKTSRNLHR